MSNPVIYDIEDYETGKRYKVEAFADDTTYDEAVDFISGLPEQERTTYEFTSPAETTPAPAPAPQQNKASPSPAPTAPEGKPTANQQVDGEPFSRVTLGEPVPAPADAAPPLPEATTETVAKGDLIHEDAVNPLRQDAAEKTNILGQMLSDPKYSEEQIRSFAQGTGLTFKGLEENLAARAEGKPVTEEIGLDPKWDKMFIHSKDPGLEPGDRDAGERGMDAYKEAVQYGFAGLSARKFHDWIGTGEDEVRKAFPGRTDEWYEQMTDYAIQQAQRGMRQEAALRQEQDPTWSPDESFVENALSAERWMPWLAGQILGSAGPESVIAPGATLAARATAQVLIGGATEGVYQAIDVAGGVEDQMSPEGIAFGALMGGGFELTMSGGARILNLDSPRGRGKDSTVVQQRRAATPLEPLDQSIRVPTTSNRKSDVYKQELQSAAIDTTRVVNEVTAGWSNTPDTKVYDNFEKLSGVDNDALGVYRSDGSVALNTEAIIKEAKARNLSTDDLVRSVMFHESLGHHGLDTKFGDDLDRMLDAFYERGAPDFRERVDQWMARNPSAYGGDRIRATEEVLAELSEGGQLPVPIAQALINKIKEFARDMGLNLKYSDDEIRAILGVAQRTVTEGDAPGFASGSGVNKYKIVYHGSGADFDRFDHSFMSSGQGAQAFGWGTYFSDSAGIASSYRDTYSTTTMSVGGVEGRTWDLHRALDNRAKAEGVAGENIEAAINTAFMKTDKITGGDVYRHYFDVGPNAKPFKELPESAQRELNDAAAWVNKNLQINKSGKLFKTELPDDMEWVEWEVPIGDQYDLDHALELNGYSVTDYATWNYVNRDAAAARLEYDNINRALESTDKLINDEDYYISIMRHNNEDNVLLSVEEAKAMREAELPELEARADELFKELQLASVKRTKYVERAKTYLHEDMTGADMYAHLAATRPEGAKGASTFLKDLGFGGNRYLADNYSGNKTRAVLDEENLYNYVVFDDATPKIVEKYMKPRQEEGTVDLNIRKFNKIITDFEKEVGTVLDRSREFLEEAEEFANTQMVDGEDFVDNVNDKLLEIDDDLEMLENRVGEISEQIETAPLSRDMSAAEAERYLEKTAVVDSMLEEIPVLREKLYALYNRGAIPEPGNDNPRNRFRDTPRVAEGRTVGQAYDEEGLAPSYLADVKARLQEVVANDKYMKPSRIESGVKAQNDNIDPVVQRDSKGRPILPGRVMGPTEAHAYYSAMAEWHNKRYVRRGNTPAGARAKARAERAREMADKAEAEMVDFTRDNRSASVRPGVEQYQPDQARVPEGADNDKYMRPSNKADDNTPMRPEDLTADELFDSLNALDTLEAITRNHNPTPMSLDDLAEEAAARGVSASEFLRRNMDDPGELTRKMFQYDIAAQKLNERLAGLSSKINSGRFTMADKQRYIKTLMQFEDLTARIFDMQSETGRVFRAIQEMQYTRKRVTTIRDLLRGLGTGLEALDDPETFAKFARAIDAQMQATGNATSRNGNKIVEAANIPRALMSSYDLSAPLRQGLFFITKAKYWTGFAQMFTYWGSEKMYGRMMTEIAQRPTYAKMQEANLAFSRTEGSLSSREEDFQTDLAKEIPIIGRGVKSSERAYVGFLNKLRADMFDSYLNSAAKAGVDVDNPEFLRGLAKFINAGTGRGDIHSSVQSMAPQLNAAFFSPRLISSRLSLLNPHWYYKLPPGVRGQAITSAAAFGSLAVLGLSTLQMAFPEATVESDPRSSDFGKVRVGDTRYDVLGGFSQYITFGARLVTGQRMGSTGELYEYKSVEELQDLQGAIRQSLGLEEAEGIQTGIFQSTVGGAFSDFGRNKAAPNASYVYDMLTGEDAIGDPSDPVEGLIQRLMPMYFQDVKESIEMYGTQEGLIRAVPGMFGVGVSSYIPKSLDPEQELEAPEKFENKKIADGENDYVVAKNGVITLKPAAREQWQERTNSYFSQIMEWEMSHQDWENLEPKEQAELIKEAKTEARREAKKDMEDVIGM